MLLAQVMIPLSTAAAVLFSLWFSMATLRRDQGPERVRAIAAPVRGSLGTLARRQGEAIGVVGLVAAVAAGLVAWSYEDSAEIGLIAAGAVLTGAVASALSAYVGVGLAGAAVSRVAAAPPDSASSAAGTALGTAAVPGLLVAGLNLGAIAGAFAITTRVLGYPTAQAPYLLVAFALGSSAVALVTRVSGGVFANATLLGAELASNPAAGSGEPASVTALAGNQAAAAGSIADVAESQAIHTVAAILLGVSLATVSGDIEWLLLPLMLGAVGVFAALVATFGAQVLAVRSPAPPRVFARAVAVALVLGAAGFGTVTWTLLDDSWYWFFLSGLVGIVAAPALMLVDRYSRLGPSSASNRVARASRSGPASNIITGLAAGFEASAITAVTVAGVVVAAFALGYQADVEHVSATSAGLFGIALAAAGLMLPAPFVATMPAVEGIALATSKVAAAAVEPGEDHASLDALAKLAAGARPAAHQSRAYSFAAAGMAVVLALLAFGEVVRANLASVATADPERYATLAQDLDILPSGQDVRFAAANAVTAATASLEALREDAADDSHFGAWHVARLAVANRDEAEGLAAGLVDHDHLTPRQASSIEPSPLALPRPLPMSFARPEVLAAGFIGLTLTLLSAAAVVRAVGRSAGRFIDELDRERMDAEPGSGIAGTPAASAARTAMRGVFPVVAGAAVVPLLAGVAARYAFGGDGNQGWLAVAGLMLTAGIGGVLLASFLEAAGAAWTGAGTLLASPAAPLDSASSALPPGSAVLEVAAVGETVGATFRDAAAPALVVVAKLAGTVALACAALFVA